MKPEVIWDRYTANSSIKAKNGNRDTYIPPPLPRSTCYTSCCLYLRVLISLGFLSHRSHLGVGVGGHPASFVCVYTCVLCVYMCVLCFCAYMCTLHPVRRSKESTHLVQPKKSQVLKHVQSADPGSCGDLSGYLQADLHDLQRVGKDDLGASSLQARETDKFFPHQSWSRVSMKGEAWKTSLSFTGEGEAHVAWCETGSWKCSKEASH